MPAPRDPLNFFQPYERLPPGHENQLTRALLLVLRLSPMAHAAWLSLVDPSRRLSSLPPAEFATQRRAIRSADDEEPAELVSVFLTPKAPLEVGIVTESDRGQVLDAIIDYGGELVVVVENKIAEADDWQAREINVTGEKVTFGAEQEARVVVWPDLLEEIAALLERNLVGGAEAGLLTDFQTYTEDHFAGLGPFRRLGLCHGNAYRQARRLRTVLNEATGLESRIDSWGPMTTILPASAGVAASAYLQVNESGDAVELSVYPADTLTQARAFYGNPEIVERLRQLVIGDGTGWRAEPNFHFGHMRTGFCWSTASCSLDHYIDTWVDCIKDTWQVPREEWDEFWSWLEKEGFVQPGDRAEFDRHFTDTKRSYASPRPGLGVYYRWPITEAEELDGAGKFAGDVWRRLSEVLGALGEAANLKSPETEPDLAGSPTPAGAA